MHVKENSTSKFIKKEDIKALEDVSDILKILCEPEKERFLGIIQGVKLITIGMEFKQDKRM